MFLFFCQTRKEYGDVISTSYEKWRNCSKFSAYAPNKEAIQKLNENFSINHNNPCGDFSPGVDPI